MATAARDRLARALRGGAESAFSAELTAKTGDLSLAVDGFGPVKFPVTPAKARKLVSLGQPARFGRGEQTLTDPDVRDTWEIPKHLVRAEWNGAELRDILTTVKEELGLPDAAELTADLHSLLVYEPNQFFLVHQDSEKDNSMIGTLVVTLPSSYTGGELMVGHNEEWKAYRGSRTALSLVAFYADCQHEVLKVKSGYRITLTYNLLLHGDTSRPVGEEGAVAELADLLRAHFSTPVPRYYGGQPTDPPNRLVYLLDHEYTARGLSWQRLKGADANRAALLRSAAGKAGCEALLALADIKNTHSAFPADERYEYRDWHDDYDEDGDEDDPGDESGSEHEYDIQELIDSEVTLTHWTGPDGARLEETALYVPGNEVCASTPTGDLKPYSSEYEGNMGNYGNTLDRWYHRAAVIVWPGDRAFANRGETSPSWALDELATMASAGDVPGAQAAAATLAPFWDSAVRAIIGKETGGTPGLFGKALRVADDVADAETAAMLLHPFHIENLTAAQAGPFGKIAGQYGQQWTGGLLRTWFGGDQPAWAYGAGLNRPQWVADQLAGLCAELHATASAGVMAAQRLLDLTWQWTSEQIGAGLASPSPGYRNRTLSDLGKPLAAVLTAAAAIGAASAPDAVCEYVRTQDDPVTALEVSALRAAKLPRDGVRSAAGFADLATDCAARLRVRLARPQRAPGDWSIELPAGGCTCELCDTLRAFLSDKSRRTFEWPLAEQRRRHIHARIDTAELPVSHLTRRQGRPYTLVLSKTEALFTQEREARIRDQSDLDWLAAK